MKGTIAVIRPNNVKRNKKSTPFKNNTPFVNSISKTNGVLIDNAEDLDVVMPMYNLLCANDACYNACKAGKSETEVAIPLKSLSNFWRTLNIPLINCEIGLI